MSQEKLTFCALCEKETYCVKYRYENNLVWICRWCRSKLDLRHNYKLKIEIKELTLRKAIIELVKDNCKKEEIKFILELNEEQFQNQISRLMNLGQYRALFKNFSEQISPKQS